MIYQLYTAVNHESKPEPVFPGANLTGSKKRGGVDSVSRTLQIRGVSNFAQTPSLFQA